MQVTTITMDTDMDIIKTTKDTTKATVMSNPTIKSREMAPTRKIQTTKSKLKATKVPTEVVLERRGDKSKF